MATAQRRGTRGRAAALRALLGSPPVAAVLSFLVPGLGQAAAGAYLRGVVWFLPAVGVAFAAARIGVHGWERGVLQPQFLVYLWWANIVVFVYHLAAVIDAFLVADRRPRFAVRPPPSIREAPDRPRSLGVIARRRARSSTGAAAIGFSLLACAVVATAGVHGFVAVVDMKDQQALGAVFNPLTPWSDATGATGTYVPANTVPGATPAPTPTPNLDWAADGRLNLLLIGIDRGPGGDRSLGLRPDTMILLQVDLKSGRAAMYGIPRNLVNVPLPPEVASHYACGCWGPAPGSGQSPDDYLLDYLWLEAADTHPDWYTEAYGNDRWVRGIRAIEGAVGQLSGVKMDGAFVIDLIGFTRLVDAIGGVDLNVPTELLDTQYPILEHPGTMTIDIKPGWQHMDGTVALEYARSRKSTDDYDRMRRQQAVLRAIREKVAHPCSMVPKVPSILDAINGTFWTDMPIESAPDMLAVAEKVGTNNIASYTLVPQSFATGSTDVQVPEYLDAAAVAEVQNIVAHGLDKVPSSSSSQGPSSGTGGISFNC